MQNHSYENDFDFHENETACRTHFHMKGFALGLVLKQRHMRTRKWPIVLYCIVLYCIVTSKTKAGPGRLVRVALFWKSHCATCSAACAILYHVTGSCRGLIGEQRWRRGESANLPPM